MTTNTNTTMGTVTAALQGLYLLTVFIAAGVLLGASITADGTVLQTYMATVGAFVLLTMTALTLVLIRGRL